MRAKLFLAYEIVRRYHGGVMADREQGGVSLNGRRIARPEEIVEVRAGDEWRVRGMSGACGG